MIVGTLVMDLLWLSGFVGLTTLSFVTGEAIAGAVDGPVGLALGTVGGLFAWLLAAATLSMLAPKPAPGKTRVMKGHAFWAWLIQFLIRRWLNMPLVTPLWSQNIWFRALVLRMMGARIARDAQMSSDVIILDPHLFRMGRRSVLGSASGATGHMMIGDRLTFAPVVIGDDVMIATHVGMLPGVTVGDGAFLEPRVSVMAFVTIGPRARIGCGASLGARGEVGAGATVARGVYVPDDTVIPDGGAYPPAEESRPGD